MKRGLLIEFNEPLDEEQDPTVDLVVAFNRAEDDALWIPHVDRSKGVDRWYWASREARGASAVRLPRTRAGPGLRDPIGKAWKCQFDPSGIWPFNIAALALEAVTEPAPLYEAMAEFFSYAADELALHLTEDPARSGPIRIDTPPGRTSSASDGLSPRPACSRWRSSTTTTRTPLPSSCRPSSLTT